MFIIIYSYPGWEDEKGSLESIIIIYIDPGQHENYLAMIFIIIYPDPGWEDDEDPVDDHEYGEEAQ